MTTILELASILAADIEVLTEMWFPCDDQGDANLSKRINLQQLFRSGLVQVGTGTPEGFVAANPGTLFYRTDGSDGTTLYVKTSGTTVTGWTAFDQGGAPGGGGTIDSAMSDTSANPVENQVIKAYVDSSNSLGPDDVVVIGSGNATTDQNNLADAVTLLNASGQGSLWIGGEVILSTELLFTAPISIRGLGGCGSIRVTNGFARVGWGPVGATDFDPILTGAIAGSGVGVGVSAITQFDTTIVSMNLELAQGDWIVLWSDDLLSGMEKNWDNQKPMEMHQIFRREQATFTANEANETLTLSNRQLKNGMACRVESTGSLPTGLSPSTTYYVINHTATGTAGPDETSTIQLATSPGGTAVPFSTNGSGTMTILSHTYVLGNYVADGMSVSPKIRRIPILACAESDNTSNVTVCDLALRLEPGVGDGVLFKPQCLNGFRVYNCHYELNSGAAGPGQILMQLCSNIRIHNIVCDGVTHYDRGEVTNSVYFLEFGVVNSAIVSDSIMKRCRHCVDTTNLSQSATPGDTRWGTARGIKIVNNIFYAEGRHSELPPVSTHGEGWGVEVLNNTFYVADTNLDGGYVAQLRSRHSHFIGNRIFGSRANNGVLLDADDCVVENNFFHNCWRCVEVSASAVAYHRNVVRGNVFKGGWEMQLDVKAGNDHTVADNYFLTFERGPLKIRTGSGHLVTGNKFHTMTSAAFNLPCVDFQSTGSASVTSLTFTNNEFINIQETCIHFRGGGSGFGTNNRIINNTFINSGTSGSLIQFTGDATGTRVAGNEMPDGPNNFSINLGSMGLNSIKIRNNCLDGYGEDAMGLTGTNAAAIQEAELGYNITD